jgi:hypothetical protein
MEYSKILYFKETNQLVPGKKYVIDDYRTVHRMPLLGRDAFHEGTVEPLSVTAESASTLSPVAFSLKHPNDVIWYDINNDRGRYEWAVEVIGKGVIYRRIDSFGNDLPYDFKNVKFRRNPVDYSNLEVLDVTKSCEAGESFRTPLTVLNNILTEQEVVLDEYGYAPVLFLNPWKGREGGKLTDEQKVLLEDATLRNFLPAFPYIGVFESINHEIEMLESGIYFKCNVEDKKLFYTFNETDGKKPLEKDASESGFVFKNIMEPHYDQFGVRILPNSVFFIKCDTKARSYGVPSGVYMNRLGDSFIKNTVTATSFIKNRIEGSFYNNIVGLKFNVNILRGDGFRNNIIAGSFCANTVNSRDFNNNIINMPCSSNVFEMSFFNCIIKNAFNENHIKSKFKENLFRQNYSEHTID